MNNKPLITFGITSYNAEASIKKTISSLILTPHDKIKSISSNKLIKICKNKFVLFDIKNYLNLTIKEYIKL